MSVDPKSLPESTTIKESRVAIPRFGLLSITHSSTAEDGMSPGKAMCLPFQPKPHFP